MAPLPALAEGFGDGAVGLGELRHHQRLRDKISAVPAPFLGHGQGAKAELGAFFDDLPVERLTRIGDFVALERERADFLFGELARRHLPGALFVAERKIHGFPLFVTQPPAPRRSGADGSVPAPRRCAISLRCSPSWNGGRCAHPERISAAAYLASLPWHRSIPPRPLRRGRSPRRRIRRRSW